MKRLVSIFPLVAAALPFLLSQVAATSPRQWNICNIINLPWKETYYAQLPIFNFLLHLNNLNVQIRKCCFTSCDFGVDLVGVQQQQLWSVEIFSNDIPTFLCDGHNYIWRLPIKRLFTAVCHRKTLIDIFKC